MIKHFFFFFSNTADIQRSLVTPLQPANTVNVAQARTTRLFFPHTYLSKVLMSVIITVVALTVCSIIADYDNISIYPVAWLGRRVRGRENRVFLMFLRDGVADWRYDT